MSEDYLFANTTATVDSKHESLKAIDRLLEEEFDLEIDGEKIEAKSVSADFGGKSSSGLRRSEKSYRSKTEEFDL